MTGNLIRNPETIAEIFRNACDRREFLILVTPYLRFESSFLRLDEGEIHAAATMGREDAMSGLRSPELKMRFPHSVSFLEASTQLKGFGMAHGRRSIRLALPATLQTEDHRGAYRVDRVGRVPVTFSTPKYDLLTGTLVDISTTGCRIFTSTDLAGSDFQAGDDMAVTIQLTDAIRINTGVKLRHIHGRTFGVEFRPQLDDFILHPLSRWVFEKREEDLERISRRGVDLAAPADVVRQSAAPPAGLVLVTKDAQLEIPLQELLGGLQPLHRIPPIISALKDACARRPALLLFHVPGLGLDDRRHLKLMVESLSGRVPFLLLGTGIEAGPLLEMGNDLKAAVSIVFHPERGTFFQRLVQGVLRRTYEGGESPMAPVEPESN